MDDCAVIADAALALSRHLETEQSVADARIVKFSSCGNVIVSFRIANEPWIGKLCRGDFPYEGCIYDILGEQMPAGAVSPAVLAQCASPRGLGQWLFFEQGRAVSSEHVSGNIATYLSKLSDLHRLAVRPFEQALPGRYGWMGRRQWRSQLSSNLGLMTRLGDRFGICSGFDPACIEERLDWMADVRESAPSTLVHGDACLDNWILIGDDLRLIDWELTRMDDPVADVQALTLFMSTEDAIAVAKGFVAAVQPKDAAGTRLAERFSVARADYCIRLAAWFLGRAASRDVAKEGAGRFTGQIDAPLESPVSLAERALNELRKQQGLLEELSR